jgi:hypothetical protein
MACTSYKLHSASHHQTCTCSVFLLVVKSPKWYCQRTSMPGWRYLKAGPLALLFAGTMLLTVWMQRPRFCATTLAHLDIVTITKSTYVHCTRVGPLSLQSNFFS